MRGSSGTIAAGPVCFLTLAEAAARGGMLSGQGDECPVQMQQGFVTSRRAIP
jgi:hypothetical protein